MRAFELHQINRLNFGHEEIAKVLGVSLPSAKVVASRYVKRGILLRLKKNLYVLKEAWKWASIEDKFKLANLGQSPSYISLTTALAYFEVTTQVQQNYFESIAVKRTKELELNNTVFRYTKIKETLYFDFKKEEGFFIASPEKALLDAFYLMSYGRYSLDIPALEIHKMDAKAIRRLSTKFPPKTVATMKRYGCFPAT